MKKILFFLVLMIFSLLLCTIAFAAEEQTVYISAAGNENATGSIDSPFDSFYSAVRALPNGGTVVLLDTLILPATKIPESYGLITITSKDGESDYRMSRGGKAKLFISGNVTLGSAVKFENIDISTAKKNLVFLCNGNYACFGEGLTVSAGASDANLPSIAAGCSGATPADGTYLEVHSGNWFRVRGGSRGTTSATQKGDISVVIYGGTFTSTFDIGGDSATEGNANLYIFDGMFTASANGASGTDIGGNVYVSIYGGRFSKTFSVSRGGNIGGDVTVNVLSDTVKSISLGTGKVSGTKTANAFPHLEYANGFTLTTVDAGRAEAIKQTDLEKIEAAKAAKLPVKVTEEEGGMFEKTGSIKKTELPLPISFDINGDGRVSLSDALTAIKNIGKNSPATDFDRDGQTSAKDAAAAIGAAAGKLPQNSENVISDTLDIFTRQNATVYLGNVLEESYSAYSDVVIEKNGKCGLYFASEGDSPNTLNGYLFEADTEKSTLSLYSVSGENMRIVASKKLHLLSEKARIGVTYSNGYASLYFEDNPYVAESYPDFNLQLKKIGGTVGVFAEKATASPPICTKEFPTVADTYQNNILIQFTDPEVFYHDGIYYVYGTATDTQNKGVQCFSTTDFKRFTDEGFVLKKGDAFGDGVFKAANIVKYGEWYYLFYMAKSDKLGTSVTAYASAKSPKGPFVNETKLPLTESTDFIGGQPFIDDNGKAYLIYVHTTGGNMLYGAELSLEGGKAEVNLATEKLLLTPTEPWENAKASVVECGFIVKHNGVYYLLYSGGTYDSTYGTGFATASSPLGEYTKYAYNPILASNDQAYGVGAASVFPSPDNSELFIIYIRNFSPTVARPLLTCIDRLRFVKNPLGGNDIIELYGPTVSPQPLPSGIESKSDFDYQSARFHR